MTSPERDMLRVVLAVMFIAIMTAASLWILQPFLLGLTWATMIVVTTWPLMLRVQRVLGGRRSLAVIVMTALMLAVFVVPLAAAIVTVVDNAAEIGRWAGRLDEVKLRSEEHTSELQSQSNLVCRLLLEKKKKK